MALIHIPVYTSKFEFSVLVKLDGQMFNVYEYSNCAHVELDSNFN